ncbi:hypothetical protein F5141DRAFT_1217677 [Pisolithus sp. B1]|nr:hypothetical protein F5141DRAFT_1217677 [Pisolithus sp. B1]
MPHGATPDLGYLQVLPHQGLEITLSLTTLGLLLFSVSILFFSVSSMFPSGTSPGFSSPSHGIPSDKEMKIMGGLNRSCMGVIEVDSMGPIEESNEGHPNSSKCDTSGWHPIHHS